jgi:hypothetical protein
VKEECIYEMIIDWRERIMVINTVVVGMQDE